MVDKMGDNSGTVAQGALSPALLERIGQALYGPQWIAPLARALDNNQRTVARWVSEYSDMPDGLADDLRLLLERRTDELAAVRADLDIAIVRSGRAATG